MNALPESSRDRMRTASIASCLDCKFLAPHRCFTLSEVAQALNSLDFHIDAASSEAEQLLAAWLPAANASELL
jgi:hypothetical protein